MQVSHKIPNSTRRRTGIRETAFRGPRYGVSLPLKRRFVIDGTPAKKSSAYAGGGMYCLFKKTYLKWNGGFPDGKLVFFLIHLSQPTCWLKAVSI